MADFTTFKSTLKGDVVEPDTADYPAAIARWAVNAQLKARYVVFPKDEADVSLAIKFATSNGIPLAIKGGGHSTSGASSVENGLCIDLSRYFDTARVDPVQKLVRVGGGAVWATVDRATIAHGLATPGGTVNHTGVGGLTLGGGYGWLSGQHGLVIDNLLQATVVTADGRVLTASETSHPDLFWGIRGGGSNFGVVTEFVLRLHPQRRTVFAGPLIFPPPLLGAVVDAVDKWWSAGIGEKEGILMAFTRGPGPERHPAVVLTVFFNGSEEEGRANYKQFYDLGPVAAHAAEIPYENLNAVLNAHSAHGRHYHLSGTSLRSKISPHASELFNRMVTISAPRPGSSPHDVMVGYELFSLKKICSLPPDATAFRSRGSQPNVVIVLSWDRDNAEGEGLAYARPAARDLAAIIESTQERAPRENENEVYVNYVGDISSMPSRMGSLWGENYPRLQQIKKVYDPNVVFDRWLSIRPVA